MLWVSLLVKLFLQPDAEAAQNGGVRRLSALLSIGSSAVLTPQISTFPGIRTPAPFSRVKSVFPTPGNLIRRELRPIILDKKRPGVTGTNVPVIPGQVLLSGRYSNMSCKSHCRILQCSSGVLVETDSPTLIRRELQMLL